MKYADPYQKLAIVYDLMSADRHSEQMTEYCRSIFNRLKIQPQRGLDLCCGTGTAIEIFTDWGITMSGLDGSSSMLAVAARKLKGRGVKLYHKRLPKFRLLDRDRPVPVTFDLVTSFYDSLNYIQTQKDLRATFRSVAEHLEPGGWFIFDMNTEAALTQIWGGQVYADAHEDIAWVWKNDYDARRHRATCQTTCFYREGTHWARFDELHTERAYPNETIVKLLKATGFEVRGLYNCGTFRKPTRNCYRIAVVARKRTGGPRLGGC
ncbi:MAG TPA: class I SAM-dependent methyltransferase [candidate division Zixibacteria bacterium]|nr:class I SAM-dependent methyltransferase [candidate division Zixibacteria bacterium]